jgi:type II secretory pathway component HofQ
MKLLEIVLFAVSTSAFASSNAYDLKMDLSLDGKHVSSPRVVVNEGEPAIVTQDNGAKKLSIEVVATEGSIQNHQGIMMRFAISTIGENGERTVIARPQILAKEGEPAKITQSDSKSGSEQLSISVTAHKTTL